MGILNITTEWQPERLIRNIVLNSPLFEQPVVGFENHGGRTYIGDHTPFGKVFYGLGNTGKSGYEGVVYKNVIATYLHGPLLPKNPQVCDYLLERALKRKYEATAMFMARIAAAGRVKNPSMTSSVHPSSAKSASMSEGVAPIPIGSRKFEALPFKSICSFDIPWGSIATPAKSRRIKRPIFEYVFMNH